ncbi:hypothetical protein BB561_002303 [Smittium simulii]|uniref:Protein kinase domain-containing protein n=1 Tax=Smittium simulii TaxID=133385 RepID=A0A2T9YQV7_9FUNG|nr:hypothetical protein BB561_002303 [Smittium simulii]
MDGIGNFFISSISNIVNRSKIPNFPYTIEEPVPTQSQTFWTLHCGTKNDTKSPVSIFVFKKDENAHLTEFANNALKRAKTLRHPDLIQYLDSAETSDAIYVVTERVSPIEINHLTKNDHGIRGLTFINEDCKLIHGNVQFSSIYVTQGLEWKLFGANLGSKISNIFTPETKNNQLSILKSHKIGITDAYQLGTLLTSIKEKKIFSDFPKIQNSLAKFIAPLLNNNPASRFTVSQFFIESKKKNNLFDSQIITSMCFIQEIHTKESLQVREFLINLSKDLDDYPEEMFKLKILPEILKKMSYGGEDSQLLSIILKIKVKLDGKDFHSIVVPTLIEAFSSNDRQLRFNLLKHLNDYIGSIPSEMITSKIFPNYISGFNDTTPIIREETTRSALLFVPYLTEQTINNELIRNICRLFTDPEPGIRANSLICIGKLSKHILASTMKKFVLSAILHSLRDPFPPSRVAALRVIVVCSSIIDPNDAARKIIPMLSVLLLDTEKDVRIASNSAITSLLALIQEYGKTLPDTAVKAPENNNQNTENTASDQSAQNQQVTTSGWVMSSLASSISGVISYKSKVGDSESATNSQADLRQADATESDNIISSTSTQAKSLPKKNLVLGSKNMANNTSTNSQTSSLYAFDGDNEDHDFGWEFDDIENLAISKNNNGASKISPDLPNAKQASSKDTWDTNNFDAWGDDPSSWDIKPSNSSSSLTTKSPMTPIKSNNLNLQTNSSNSNSINPRPVLGQKTQSKLLFKTAAANTKTKSRLGAVKLPASNK